MSPTTAIRRESGFTLVELVIALVLLGIVGAVGVTMISDSFTTTQMINADSASRAEARYAVERLAREIREVKYLSAGNYCFISMDTTSLVIQKRNNGDTNVDNCSTGTTAVAITYSGTHLTLLYTPPGGSASPLSSQVSAFSLTYWGLDQSGNLISNPSAANVRLVDIALTVADATSGQQIAERTRVALRNL